jgi:hypothetical protein
VFHNNKTLTGGVFNVHLGLKLFPDIKLLVVKNSLCGLLQNGN